MNYVQRTREREGTLDLAVTAHRKLESSKPSAVQEGEAAPALHDSGVVGLFLVESVTSFCNVTASNLMDILDLGCRIPHFVGGNIAALTGATA